MWSQVVVVCLLSIVLIGAAGQECEIPEEQPRPKPFLEALQVNFETKGYEYDRSYKSSISEIERWENEDGGDLELVKADDFETARLTFRLSDRSTISTSQRGEMKDFIAIAVPDWVEGRDWVGKNMPIALSGDVGDFYTKAFSEKYHEEIVGDSEEIRITLVKNKIHALPMALTLTVTKHD